MRSPTAVAVIIKNKALNPSPRTVAASHSPPASTPMRVEAISRSNMEIQTTKGINKKARAPKTEGNKCGVFCTLATQIIRSTNTMRRMYKLSFDLEIFSRNGFTPFYYQKNYSITELAPWPLKLVIMRASSKFSMSIPGSITAYDEISCSAFLTSFTVPMIRSRG